VVPTAVLLVLEKTKSSYPAGKRNKIYFLARNTILFGKNYYFMECVAV
jgi:hypothetical protein